MRAVIQRVSRASVTVEGEVVGEIGPGLLILLGIGREDGPDQVERLAAKIPKLRVFDDAEGRPNLPLGERGILCVSQFTLYADIGRGNRPSYAAAAPAEQAEPLYGRFCELLGAERGVFGARMSVSSENDGPLTVLVSDATGL